MAKTKFPEKSLILYEILNEKSDPNHKLSMAEIIKEMEDCGVSVQRETVYRLIEALNKHGMPVHFSRLGKQGYWLEHLFTPGEAMILLDSIQGSMSLSPKETERISAKIKNHLSKYEVQNLRSNVPSKQKTENPNVIKMIDELLPAIDKKYEIDFLYYDMTIRKEKVYRHNKQRYHSVPYAIVSNGGRYYCVMYSDEHQDFAGFRIDRMDHLVVRSTQRDSIPFDIDAWIRASFNMYKGEATTVQLRVRKSLANAILEQFGENIILQSENDEMYQLALRTGITPTLISWILQYPEQIIVDGPNDLIQQIIHIGTIIQETYQRK